MLPRCRVVHWELPYAELMEAGAGEEARCNPIDSWREVRAAPVQPAAAGAADDDGEGAVAMGTPMKLWLLGDRARRGQLERTVRLHVPAAAGDALLEEHAVTTMPIAHG